MSKRIAAVFFACLVALASNAEEIRIGDDYVRQGDTVFVRQGAKPYRWVAPLNDALNPFYRPTEIKKVVFVDMGSVGRWDKVGAEVNWQKWMKDAAITTIVVGACENYCAARFTGGATRLLAKGAYLDLKAPIDFDTKRVEARFPAPQFAMFERNTAAPAALAYKHVFFEAFTKGGMTGGTRFYADQVQFCEARNPDQGCKIYEGLDAYKVGLITDPRPVAITLPVEW